MRDTCPGDSPKGDDSPIFKHKKSASLSLISKQRKEKKKKKNRKKEGRKMGKKESIVTRVSLDGFWRSTTQIEALEKLYATMVSTRLTPVIYPFDSVINSWRR
jgi:hypothetical protein